MSLKPKKTRIIKGKAAWWYDERGGIRIYISGFGTVLSCSIKRSALAKYLKRSRSKENDSCS